MFDPTIGRWQTKDPKSFDAGDTNLYRYVGNHPSYATDPSGLEELPDFQSLSRSQFNKVIQGSVKDRSVITRNLFDRTTTRAYVVPFQTNSGEPYYALFEHQSTFAYDPEIRWAGATIDSYRLAGVVPGGHNLDSAIELVLAPKKISNANNMAVSLEFALHLVPFGATADYTAQGDLTNAGASAAGDLAAVLTLGAGKVLQVGAKGYGISKKVLRAGQTLEGAVGIYRTGQGAFKVSQGEGGQGEIAEGLLRLLGVSVSLIPANAIAPIKGSGINFVGADDAAAAGAALERMVARVKGMKSGGNHVVIEVEAFGSRAGSTWKGRGALPNSDLDIIIRDFPGAFEAGAKGSKKLRDLLDDIKYDFYEATGVKVDLKVWSDDPFMRSRMAPPFKKL